MKIDIYKSTKNGNKYLSVPAGTDMQKLTLPASADSDIRTLSPFKTRLELDLSRQRAVLDQKDVMEQIQKNGFAIHDAKAEITVGSAA